MLHPMARLIPSAADRAKAKRLKMLWESRKNDLELTQVKAAREMGITQPTFSQYINCVIPLNTDAILKFSDLLRVPPTEIDPSLKNVMTLKPVKHVRERHIPLIGSTSGRGILKYASVKVTNIEDQGVFAGIVVDDTSLIAAGVTKGSVIVVDLDADPYVRKRNVMLRERGSDSFVFAASHRCTWSTPLHRPRTDRGCFFCARL
jgi:SOS-response transcriptional repressor LexA